MQGMADKLFEQPKTDPTPVDETPATASSDVALVINPDGPLDASVEQYISVPGSPEVKFNGSAPTKVPADLVDSFLVTNFVKRAS